MTPIFSQMSDNSAWIKDALGAPTDLVIRTFTIGQAAHPCTVVCIDGLVDKVTIYEELIKPLLVYFSDYGITSMDEFAKQVASVIVANLDTEASRTLEDAVNTVLAGNCVLFIDGLAQMFSIDSQGWKSRGIEEPQTESVIRGPHEGFIEDLRSNTALLRRRLRDPRLRLRTYKLGLRSKRQVVLAYIEDIIQPEIVQEADRRLNSISIDDIAGSATVEHWIADSFLSPFPLISNTERPDKVSGALLQGRAAILVDGDPFVLILPISFVSNIHSPEDFYQNWLISTLTRVLRVFSGFIATFLPALYIALLEYHHGMIPSKLAFSIAGSREGVPFPAVVEAFMMETTLELLREAGVRLPKAIGQTIGIVGGLVIGEAAVTAGIVSPVMVIVVAVTAIASFSFPSYSFAISLRMIRFAIMIAAAAFGLYGIILAFIMISIHFVNLRSFGIPYSAPAAPFFAKDMKDTVVRAPLTFMEERPETMKPLDTKRLKKEGR
ncbi:spore germination protein [Paenibacillus whitsoniae]|uniref:Spore germination protein n=2 Tax=Paenibacillus whitsoniae TaxID=2496558 RepID=A0A3S0C9I8_9BACL|nr:spore germination protein [Paenibacillus whitsoniae]RTE08962.1 spore germination protein [Paenibacillus whitsoniae]